MLIINAFIETGNIDYAAGQAGVCRATAATILKKPDISEYIEGRMLEHAGAAGVTKEAVMFAIADLLKNPLKEASQAHLKALDIAAKILKLVQPNLHIHQGAPESKEFKDMTDEQFYAEWEKRMAYRGQPVNHLAQEMTSDAKA